MFQKMVASDPPDTKNTSNKWFSSSASHVLWCFVLRPNNTAGSQQLPLNFCGEKSSLIRINWHLLMYNSVAVSTTHVI